MKLCILYGGTSTEREVSINTGMSVYESIKDDYDITMYDYNGDFNLLNRALKNIDLVFIALHGGDGENGQIQKKLGEKKIKFTGSDFLASSIAMNKDLSKKKCIENNILTPEWAIVEDSGSISNLSFKGKVVVKPVCEGSSVGMSIVNSCYDQNKNLSSDLKKALDFCYSVSDHVMIEEFIEGRELTVSILNNRCLPAVEILPKGNFYDYKCKYTKGESEYIVPAILDFETKNLLNECSIKIHKSIGCRGYSRVDFRLGNNGKVYFLELNTLPGFTSTSLFPKAADAEGLDYSQLLKNIIRLAL
jgi:D-alanine-D-alanine ligase